MTQHRPRAGLRARFAAAALALVAAALVAEPAGAVFPSAEKVRRAVAAANQRGARTQRLVLDVALVAPTGEVGGTGRMTLDPEGAARLELVLVDGRAELHERGAAGYRASRDGAAQGRPLPLLPPARLLQAASGDAVAEALRGLGGDPEVVDLGLEGTSDCWVLGGRDRGPFEANLRPSLWMDLESHQIVRIDEPEGRFRLGPYASFGALRFPRWIEAEAPGAARWRLEVRGPAAQPAAAPATP